MEATNNVNHELPMNNKSASQDNVLGGTDSHSDGVGAQEQNSGSLGEYEVLPSPPTAAPPTRTSHRRRRQRSRSQSMQSDELASQLSNRLRDASALLLDRLFDYLSKCPAHDESNDESTIPNRQQHPQRGLTLPASAIGWLSMHLYPDDGEHECEDEPDELQEEHRDWWMQVPTRDRLPLIRFLLPRATHLRVTSEEWPPPPSESTKKKKKSTNRALAQAVRQSESMEGHEPFFRYYFMLQHSPRLDMRVFPNLSVLLLDGIPPEWLTNMNVLQNSLELLRMERGCIYNMTTFLFPQSPITSEEGNGRIEEESDAYVGLDGLSSPARVTESQDITVFQKLTHLKLTHCAIGEFAGLEGQQQVQDSVLNDEESKGSDLSLPQSLSPPPLSRLSNLVSLSLANNELVRASTALAGLSSLPFLSKLDLSFNRLSRMDDAFMMLGNLKVLLLSGNLIENAKGLDRLYSLEQLALDRNRIQDLADVAGLARLPELSILNLYGNRFAEKNPDGYRVEVLNTFRETRFFSLPKNATYRQLLQILPILDGKCATNKELVALRYLAFNQFISSPIHGGEPVENQSEGGGRNEESVFSHENELLDRPEPQASFPVSTPQPDLPVTVVVTTPQSRFRRVTRRSKTRRAVIGDSVFVQSPIGSEKATKGKIKLTNGRGNISMNFQQIHSRLRTGFVSETPLKTPRVPKVSFSVQDVIATLPVATSVSFRSDELSDEEPALSEMVEHGSNFGSKVAKAEESDVFPASKKIVVPDKDIAPQTELGEDTESKIADVREASLQDEHLTNSLTGHAVSSTGAADLSLLSISTVNHNDESVNGYPDTSFVAEKKSVYREAVNGDYDSSDGKNSALSPMSKKEVQDLGGAECHNLNTSGPRNENPKNEFDRVLEEKEANVVESRSAEEPISEHKNGSSTITPKSGVIAQDDENIGELILKQASFPSNIWDDDTSLPSSLGASRDDVPAKVKYKDAEETSLYDGPESYKGLSVLVNLELYFRCFVFPSSSATIQQPWYGESDEDDDKSILALRVMPRIQLCNADWETRRKSDASQSRESFRHVWSEEVVACGKPACSRLSPNRTPRRGFHGDIVFAQGKLATVSECRKLIFCSSDAALYLISDYDSVTSQSLRKLRKRQFPMPIPQEALFENAPWPHAVARHPIRMLHRITIGFGFQRLTLHFSTADSGAQDYIYVLMTCNKLTTISLLQKFQDHVKDTMSAVMAEGVDDTITIDNDDKKFLDALAIAVAPTVVGIVLHYQILQQRWKHGDRGSVRRACVVTDSRVFLLDEDYVGDGSSVSSEVTSDASPGDVCVKVVESAELHQIVEVIGADADPRSITIIVRPSSRLKRTHRWRLLCKDGDGAERLVEDVRKAIRAEAL